VQGTEFGLWTSLTVFFTDKNMKNDYSSTTNSFLGKTKIFSHEYLRSCLFLMGSDAQKHTFTKKLYLKLSNSTQLLEDFLDYHGAKNNSDWYFYRELTAAVRHLSKACYPLKHITNRLHYYDISGSREFVDAGNVTLGFLNQALIGMAPVIIEEARRLKIPIPENSYDATRFPDIVTTDMLDYDIDDHHRDIQKQSIVTIASDFFKIAKQLSKLEFFEPYSARKMFEIVPAKINEVITRQYEMQIHNLQSTFDTYVIHGGFKLGDKKLKSLRSTFSLVLHLFQAMGCLLHFYERHLYDVGYKNVYKKTHDRLADLINKEAILDRTINFGLFYVCHFLSMGKSIAKDILNENIERSAVTVGIPLNLGFHSRPSLLVAKIVQHYGGQVELCVNNDRFDASSVLDIQWAGGKIQKENISEVIFEGDIRSLEDIKILAGVNYGENTMGRGIDLPEELDYLK